MKKNILKPIDIVFAILGSISILIFVIHYSSLYINAASVSNGSLPYVVPQYREANSFIPDGALNKALTYYRDIVTGYLHYSGSLDYIVYTQDGVVNGYYEFIFICNPTIDSNITSDYNFLDSSITVRSNNIQIVWVKVKTDNFNTYSYNVNKGWTSSLLGSSSTQSQFGGNFTPRYPFYLSNEFEVSKNDILVFTNTSPINPSPIVTGHATEPNNDTNNNINSDGQAQQPNTPTFPIFTPPNIDTSTLETLLESLIDFVSEFADYVGECFSTFFSWLVDVIKNGLQSIINEIRDFKDFLYDNFVSLFESISSNIEYIAQPIDSTIIFDNIGETSLVSNIGTIESSVNSFKTSFDNLSEPTSYTIPIHLEDLPTNYFGNLTTQYIDLGVINPVKNAIRVFVWALTTYGLFITIVDSISNYINGGQDE